MALILDPTFSHLHETLESLLNGKAQGLQLFHETKDSQIYSLESSVAFIKLYRPSKAQRIFEIVRGPKAKREYTIMKRLERDFDNPIAVIGWADRKRFGIPLCSLIVTKAWPGATDVKRFTRELRSGQRSRSDRAVFVQALPNLLRNLRELHDRGCLLGTAFAKNLLFRTKPKPQWAWIDQTRARVFPKALTWKQRCHDLACLDKGAQLLLSPRERLLAFRAYLGSAMTKDHRPLLRRIEARRRVLDRQGFGRRLTHALHHPMTWLKTVKEERP